VKVRGKLPTESSGFHGRECEAYWPSEIEVVWSDRISHTSYISAESAASIFRVED
jgi:hypothetical protein